MKTEYLSDDLLDEGYLKLFAPFRFCQLFFGSCRIDARDRFVTAPTWGQKAYTVIILILAAAFFAGLLFLQLTSLMEWIFCSNIIIYFCLRLRFINAIMRNHLKGLPNGREVNSKFFLPTRKSMRCVVANMHELNSSATDEYLKDIFDVISRFQELFRFQILRWLEFILLPFQTVIDLMMIVVFCVRCEAFRIEIQDIKRLSTTLLSIYQEGPIREKARKMLKLINEKPPHISVYDMWNMDASTMLNMINVVTTLLVTLLQFALL
nr:uncharacterized protein LOC116766385 [Danaus plexippus plexippus]